MVKSFVFVAGLVALAGQNVYGQDINPTSILAGMDSGSLSSVLAQAESSLAAMQTNPTYSSLIASNPTFSSAMAQASSYLNNPSAAAASSKPHNSGSSVQPIGVAALVISAAVAVGML